jgi:hypothetical protein
MLIPLIETGAVPIFDSVAELAVLLLPTTVLLKSMLKTLVINCFVCGAEEVLLVPTPQPIWSNARRMAMATITEIRQGDSKNRMRLPLQLSH